jgi:hypothetical protein
MIAQCLIGGYGWLQVKCRRCEAGQIRLSMSAGRDTRYGSCAQMPIMPHTAVLAAGTPD